MNLSGATTNSAEDDVAEFTNNNGAFSGVIDINDQGQTSFRNVFSGNYSADPTIAGRGSVVQTRNAPLLTTYVIDSSTAVAVSADTGFVGLGALVAQNASAKSNVVANHLSVLRSRPSARAKSARQKSLPARTQKSSLPARMR
jgi:ABC-type branched-subunit amino acid transport system ATPase component